MQALVAADAQAHVMGVLYGGEIEMLAPHERPEAGDEFLPRADIPGRRTGLDPGGALPGAALALVILLRRVHADADRRHRRVRAQPQIGAKHIALGGVLAQKPREAAGGADEAAACLVHVCGGEAAFVEQADEIDVGGVIELMRAHLAHRHHHHAEGGRIAPRRDPRQPSTRDLGAEKGAKARLHRRIGKAGERRGDLHQIPRAAEIRERHEKREPALGAAQAGGELIGRIVSHLADQAIERVFRAGAGRAQPFALTRKQPREIGAAPGRAGDQFAQVGREIGEGFARLAASFAIMRDRGAGDAACEIHCRRMLCPAGRVNHHRAA